MRPQIKGVVVVGMLPLSLQNRALPCCPVLNSERAIHVNIEIMRAFVRLREMLATHRDLARKLEAMEKKYDAQFKVVFDAIRQLMSPVEPKKRKIGFLVKERAAKYGRSVISPRR